MDVLKCLVSGRNDGVPMLQITTRIEWPPKGG
jgi:hypothetical protein